MLRIIVHHLDLYPSSFKLHLCWLPSLTPVTYWRKLLGIRSVAALMQLEIYWVYTVRSTC
ncbi:hypothetical protein DDT54_19485 [Brenneria nigrifluens DSM 30175 = ATCC 13028]|uniref:Uncharacterized protein n=1 Tax=Brenneria nigrifluens DSM 30175 = ATCC 13028 TaxID=1121120 RepID=A0A2U1UHN5_9GAMM|nr:hypothetical protein DDT54_19485 [Brenneria nigrifluens DSM 30175 = ATCC 13028]